MFKVDKWTSLKKILGPVLLELLVLFVIFMQRRQVDFFGNLSGKTKQLLKSCIARLVSLG
jgi:hypothetical protein